MCADSQSNWLPTIAVRASYILYPPRKKTKQNPLCLFEFWGGPFQLPKFY